MATNEVQQERSYCVPNEIRIPPAARLAARAENNKAGTLTRLALIVNQHSKFANWLVSPTRFELVLEA